MGENVPWPEMIIRRGSSIRVTFDLSRKEIAAYSSLFNLYGVGLNHEHAVLDLILQLKHEYQSLSCERVENLDESAIDLLNLYQAHLGNAFDELPSNVQKHPRQTLRGWESVMRLAQIYTPICLV